MRRSSEHDPAPGRGGLRRGGRRVHGPPGRGGDGPLERGGLRRLLSLWLPVAAWLVVIAVTSGDVASRSGTESSFLHFLAGWWPGLAAALRDASWWAAAGWAVRKAAHLAEYGVLALLLLRAFRGGTRLRGPIAAAAAIAFCVLVASGDELHQAGVASRSGSAVDVGIDLLGAALALAAAWAWGSRRRRGTA